MITVVGFVVLAGVGALGRAGVGSLANRSFPYGTLAVNVIGAFALGLLAGRADPVVTALGTAGLGALTTFSSFARDAVALLEEDRPAAGFVYVVGTLVLGVAAAALGLTLVGA